MIEKQQPLQMRPDMDLAERLRKNFSARSCVEETLWAIQDMATAIGVDISFEIESVDRDKIVDRDKLTEALGRMATASGSMLMGGKVNPITVLNAQDPLKIFPKPGHNVTKT